MLKIYGADLSSPANKIRFLANSIGLEYEYVRVNIREGESKTAEFLKLHPAGKIPVMDDDGFVLFESAAICKYLCRKHSSPLYPQDLQAVALIDQWSDFVTLHVNHAMGRILYNRIFAPIIKVDVDERSLQDGVKFLSQYLPIVDKKLGQSKYLAAEHLTFADISLLSALDPAEVAQVDLTPFANILVWRNDLKQKDFYIKCHKEYGEQFKK